MNFFTLMLQLFSLFLLLSLSFLVSASDTSKQLFQDWCKQHGKTYPSEEEERYRFKVFQDNYAFVTQHNQMQNSSYTLSLNAFADLTHHEFKTTRLGLPPSSLLKFKFGSFQDHQSDDDNDVLQVPSEIDWRNSGAVTSVKDQGSCGIVFYYYYYYKIIIKIDFSVLYICSKSYNLNVNHTVFCL
jgi:C1A family cysteine protease